MSDLCSKLLSVSWILSSVPWINFLAILSAIPCITIMLYLTGYLYTKEGKEFLVIAIVIFFIVTLVLLLGSEKPNTTPGATDNGSIKTFITILSQAGFCLTIFVPFLFGPVWVADAKINIEQLHAACHCLPSIENIGEAWEVSGLLATFWMTILFWVQEMFEQKHLQGFRLVVCQISLVASLVLICFAYLWVHQIANHLYAIILVSCFFAAHDFVRHSALNVAGKNDDATEAKLFAVYVDIPSIIGFIIILIFFKLQDSQDNLNYFIAGAIAFQLLNMNAVYLLISFFPATVHSLPPKIDDTQVPETKK